jgi:hypothetical protein
MRHWAVGAVISVSLVACSHKKTKSPPPNAPGRVLFATSFENLEGWVTETPSLTNEKAHTGQYAIKVDQATEFSLTYLNKLVRLSPQRFDKVRLTGWGFLTAPGAASVVFQITGPDQSTVFYDKIDITEVDAWQRVSKVMTLPAVLNPTDQVRIYLWRAEAKAPVYLDDVKLSIEP